MVKGGVALDLRLGDRARSTQDLDLAIAGLSGEIDNIFIRALESSVDDFFGFHVKHTLESTGDHNDLAMSFQVRAELDGRRFEDIAVDVGSLPDQSDPIELITGRALLAYADIVQTIVPIISIEQHLAEKLHAYTAVHPSGRQNTRVKDLVDIALIAEAFSPRAGPLQEALRHTYVDRSQQDLPTAFSPAPKEWEVPFRRLSTPTGIQKFDLESAEAIAKAIFNPVLGGLDPNFTWDANRGNWSNLQSDQMAPLA